MMFDVARKALTISREAEPLFTLKYVIILLVWGPQR